VDITYKSCQALDKNFSVNGFQSKKTLDSVGGFSLPYFTKKELYEKPT